MRFPKSAVTHRDPPFGRPEGGKTVADVFGRTRFVRRYVERQAAVTTLVSALAAFDCIFTEAMLNPPLNSHRGLGQASRDISVLSLVDGSWHVELLNSASHLCLATELRSPSSPCP